MRAPQASEQITATRKWKIEWPEPNLGGPSGPEDSTQLHCKFNDILNDLDWSSSDSRGMLGNNEPRNWH